MMYNFLTSFLVSIIYFICGFLGFVLSVSSPGCGFSLSVVFSGCFVFVFCWVFLVFLFY